MTSSYYDPDGRLATLLRSSPPVRLKRLGARLLRRHEPEIPPACVRTVPSFDVALRLEARLAGKPTADHAGPRTLAHRPVRCRLAASISAIAARAVLLFSDVGSKTTLPSVAGSGFRRS